jgi:hypothetical protein
MGIPYNFFSIILHAPKTFCRNPSPPEKNFGDSSDLLVFSHTSHEFVNKLPNPLHSFPKGVIMEKREVTDKFGFAGERKGASPP